MPSRNPSPSIASSSGNSAVLRAAAGSIVYKTMLRKQLGIDVVSVTEQLGDDKLSLLRKR
ncbi:MAG: hypothetical protein ACLS8R_06240 [Anaeromassilibacillus sp.]